MRTRTWFMVVLLIAPLFVLLRPCFTIEPPAINEADGIDINTAYTERADSFMILTCRGLSDPRYEDSSRQLHPSILSIPEGWPADDAIVLPWKQWLAVTPMATCDADENPHLFVRNKIDDEWTYVIGSDSADSITNPLFVKSQFILDTAYWYCCDTDTAFYDTTDGTHDSVTVNHTSHHLSDPDLFLDQKGNLWMAFRVSWSVSGIDMHALYAARSANGKDWPDIYRITHLGRFMCPAIVCNEDSSFTMYCTSQSDQVSGFNDERLIYRFRANRLDTLWVFDRVILFANVPRHFRTPWHIDVLPGCNGELVSIIQTIKRSALWLAVSYDSGDSWTIADQPFLKSDGHDSAIWDNILYRASGYWMDDHCCAMGLYYSAYHVADTNGISPGGEITVWHTGFTIMEF